TGPLWAEKGTSSASVVASTYYLLSTGSPITETLQPPSKINPKFYPQIEIPTHITGLSFAAAGASTISHLEILQSRSLKPLIRQRSLIRPPVEEILRVRQIKNVTATG
ncbi:hypothetical protein AKJ16_DCAP19050, partial [Drosera capensis]